jgi:hypothetical protein
MKKYENLLNYRERKHSKIGNDGIIEFIFKKLGIDNGTFVEFGAWDGVYNSNCRTLFEKGWNGVFIEPDDERYRGLKENYKMSSNVYCSSEKVTYRADKAGKLFDDIVNPYLKGKNIDFCAIDIDGLDLEVFETFEKYLPVVVCIEGGMMLHPYHIRIKKSLAKKLIQQSLSVMVNSFEKKGYKLLCSYQDCFFIKEEYYHLFPVSENLLTLYFDGLRALPERIPFVQKYLSKVGLNNEISDYILKGSNYKKYGWKNRKVWSSEQIKIINKLINKREKIEKNKYEK